MVDEVIYIRIKAFNKDLGLNFIHVFLLTHELKENNQNECNQKYWKIQTLLAESSFLATSPLSNGVEQNLFC